MKIEKIASAAEYQESLAIRRQVFIREQEVPEELEIDALTPDMTVFVVRDDTRKAVATGRYRKKGGAAKFERIATLKSARGLGLGQKLMAHMERDLKERHPTLVPYMHAQLSAVTFYERIGWRKVGALFVEAGIDHYLMVRGPIPDDVLASLLANCKET